jgi:uncharacterized membrane protein (UPF0127 family)
MHKIIRRTVLAILLFIVIGGGLYLRAGQESAPSQAPVTAPLTITAPNGQQHIFTAEIADTPEKMRDGLMFRKELAADSGMLFVLPAVQATSFWMKNTLIPLDILFIGADGRVAKVHANAQPHDLTPIPSGGPVAAALEIAGGQAAKRGITAGSTVSSPVLRFQTP